MAERQAVIVIHGIGEQRPLDTLRGFVKALVDKPIRNKPDPMSRLFELRRLQAPSDRDTPLTDFYEYYWAYRMRDTKPRMVWRWLRSLVLRNPRRIPRQLWPFYLLSWVMMAVVVLTVIRIGWHALGPGSAAALLGSLVGGWLAAWFFAYVGDAARYLDPHPDNIEQRNKIRQEGIALLHALHESKKYSRIIVVGHSLGSVIGYDLLRLYWSSIEPPELQSPQRVTELREFEEARDSIFENAEISEAERVELYQQLQFRLWRALRTKRHWPWLVTDFVTLGSPLTHSRLLLSRNEDDFHVRRKEGELVTCPPTQSGGDIWYSRHYKTAVGPRNADTPTHMVPFACTRWTNIYFPHRRLILGDMIGGPLQECFCSGVRDVPVGLTGLWGTLISHVCYWGLKTGKARPYVRDPERALKSALRLNCRRSKVKLPEP